ncbi:GerMN domain-containing protein [Arthrobacter cupressi]
MVGRRGYGRSTSAAPLRALSLRKLSLRRLWLRRLSLCTVALGGAVLCLGSCAYPAGIAPESAPAATAPTAGSAAAYPGRASQLPETVPVPAATPAAPPTPEPAAPGATSPGAVGKAGPDAPIPVAEPGTAPPAAPSRPAEAPVRTPGEDPDTAQDHAALYGPAIYLVAIDDGGSRGARFGCNDSLVAVRSDSQGGTGGDAHGSAAGQGDSGQASAGPAANTPSDPLEAAMSRLLGPDSVPAGSGLYNALAASALTFVSGQLEGTTAVVSLSGELRQGGVCDGPRIEAQLTQTAIAATGASRAEIRIGGRPLAELLSLR